MPDAPAPVEVALDRTRTLDPGRRLLHRPDVLPHAQAGTEGGVDALVEVEVEVPRLEVFEHVRHVHARPGAEIRLRAEVDEPKRLEVGDLARPESVLLRRREAEEELGIVRDQVRTRNAGCARQLLRQASAAAQGGADEAAAPG